MVLYIENSPSIARAFFIFCDSTINSVIDANVKILKYVKQYLIFFLLFGQYFLNSQ